jgi:hypothetical protein
MVSLCSTGLGSKTTFGKKSILLHVIRKIYIREMNSVVAAVCCDRNINGSHYIYPWV